MDNNELIHEAFDARARRREERRAFFRTAAAAGAAVAGASVLASCGGKNDNTPGGGATATPTPTATSTSGNDLTDVDVLVFALQLEYLEAQFYSFAANGVGLPNNLLTGAGVQGAVSGGRQVNFTDPLVAKFAREIAGDELAHVTFLRRTLGSAVVAQPPIDVSANSVGGFSAVARAAGLAPAGGSFDPYASDENFLLGAFIFEDVGVTAYKGAAPLISSKVFLEASAGLLAAEAYHAGLIRTVLSRKGLATPMLINASEAISSARDAIDGSTDIDQGVRPIGDQSNVVPTDSNGLAFSRSTLQVLNILFVTNTSTITGGFFPSGLNGRIVGSGAN